MVNTSRIKTGAHTMLLVRAAKRLCASTEARWLQEGSGRLRGLKMLMYNDAKQYDKMQQAYSTDE
jgi:hypothetical protein